MDSNTEHFLKPSRIESLLNKAVGVLSRLGLGPRYIHVLEVQGRRTGKTYSTPVNVLELNRRRFLVGGRGHSTWSKNAQANGIVTLRRGRTSQRFRVIAMPDNEKPQIIKAYLEEYPRTVQRFFTVPAGSPVDAFAAIAHKHPVFELVVL
jgi:deazaflavin-dependent oxidoreductase (nitroreductase family)